MNDINVYVLNSEIKELDGKTISDITDIDFINLGTKYSIKEFEEVFNDSVVCRINSITDYIRFL